MPFRNSHGLEYYYFDIFPKSLIQGVFTRSGGVSPKPWDTLNLGGTVGDAPENVNENRARLFKAIDRPEESIFDTWQVHGNKVICAASPRNLNLPHQKADAIITNLPDVTILMRFADCTPILLYDPVLKVFGMAHAGWSGTLKKVTAKAVYKMTSMYGCNPKDILAGLGPSICVDHYEVGADVSTLAKSMFESKYERVVVRTNGKTHFNLWEANKLILEEAGIREIQVSGECTACHSKKWYSHRAENGETGRFAAVMALK